MIKKLILSVLIQSLGTISSFCTIWFITNQIGIFEQGNFAIIKSWIDFLIVLGCFGFPQSVIYIINKYKLPHYLLLHAFNRYLLILSVPLFLLTISWSVYYNSLYITFFYSFMVTIASILLISHGLLRGIYLTVDDGATFSIITATPAIFLFISIALLNYLDIYNIFVAYFISSLISYLAIRTLLYTKITRSKTIKKTLIPWRELIIKGFSAFIQALSLTIFPIITYAILYRSDISTSEIGGFNIALYFYMILAIPFSMISPILFNRWMKEKNKNICRREVNTFLCFSLILLFLPVILLPAADHIIPIFFNIKNDEISYITTPLSILFFAATPLLITRIITPYFLSNGEFHTNTIYYLLKVILCSLSMIILFIFELVSITSISWIWFFGDLILAILFLIKYYQS